MDRSISRTVLAISFAAVISGCTQQEPASPPPVRYEQTLHIGLIPEQNIFRQFERYEPLAEYLSKKVGMNIELTVLPRYGNIIDNFRSENLDGAFFGSFTYTLAHAKLGVTVLARPENLNGVSTYHGLILVRRDSGIRTVQDMAGKRFAFVDKATTAGYLLPLAYFRKHGIDYRTYLKETYFAGTHEDAIQDVMNRMADIAAAKNTVFDRMALADPRIAAELMVLERSPDVPENGLAMRGDLDGNLAGRILRILVSMQDDPEGRAVLRSFGARRFIGTADTDYQPVYEYTRKVGLDLATYDYRNN